MAPLARALALAPAKAADCSPMGLEMHITGGQLDEVKALSVADVAVRFCPGIAFKPPAATTAFDHLLADATLRSIEEWLTEGMTMAVKANAKGFCEFIPQMAEYFAIRNLVIISSPY